jgi:uncharacterized alpha-E superfamily protein
MHKQYLTADRAFNLYWLGRHIKRIEIEIVAIDRTFNQIIDKNREAGRELFSKLDIELKYQNALEYLEECMYGDHEGRMYDIIQNARENAIIARNYLQQDAFTAIIELHQFFEKNANNISGIDYQFVDTVLGIIIRIWGAMHQFLKYQMSYDFIRLGQLVEKVDLSMRLDEQRDFALLRIDDIDALALKLNRNYEKENLCGLKCSKILDHVNEKINKVITDKI